MAIIPKNLQTEGGVYIDKWWTGLYKNRSPLFTPITVMGITVISRRDALIDGLNMMISPQYSLKRRYGHSKACSVAFGTGEWPLAFASFQQTSGNIIPMVDTQTNVYTFSTGAKTSIYTKLAGAVQSSFVSDLTWMYWVDGVSANKFDGTNVWKLGIATPATAPVISTIESGAAAANTAWQASTWFSTMGIMVDSNGNAEQLLSINNNGSQFGTSSQGHPPWNNTPGSITTETGGVQWRNEGQLGEYDQFGGFYKFSNDLTYYGNGQQSIISGFMWDSVHNALYTQTYNGGVGVALPAGAPRPGFSGVLGSQVIKNFCTFHESFAIAIAHPSAWAPGTAYTTTPTSLVYQPSKPPSSVQTPVYLMSCTNAGTSTTSYTAPSWPAFGVAGPTTIDNQLTWISLGSATWVASHAYKGWSSSSNQVFNCIKDGAGNLQVCIKSGNSGSQLPVWGTTYGAQTDESAQSNGQLGDGTAVWVCVGTDTGWKTNTIHYLPSTGFNAPLTQTSYGSSSLKDSNGNAEFVTNTGVSQNPGPPGWATAKGSTTTDNTITWTNNGTPLPHSLTWSSGYAYAYSYKARATTDFYSVATGSPALLPVPPGSTFGSLPAPSGSMSGQISTASPVTLVSGSNAGAENILTITGSTDPQVDTIIIWRSKDGGGSTNMFELTEIPNPIPVNGLATTATYIDFQPDSVLNTQILAPISHQNDPPPTGASIMVWHAGRLWVAVGNTIYWSGGPDTVPGVGQESWPPGNNFALPGNVTAMTSTTQGLIISVNDDEYVSTGTTSATFTVPIIWQANFGVANENCIAQDGDNVFFFTVKGQIWHFSANGLEEIGYLNGVDFAAMTPANVHIAIHRSGTDEGLFVSDGSANLWRYSQNTNSWDPQYQPVGGVFAIGSTETSNGTWQLLIGRPTGSGFILKRDLSLFTDDGSAYSAFATVGSLLVAPPRQTASIASVLIQTKVIGTYPTVSVMLNEVQDLGSSNFPATFTVLPNPVVDPPQLVGYQKTIYMKRHDFKAAQVPLPGFVQHMQVKVDFGNDTVGNELYGLGLA